MSKQSDRRAVRGAPPRGQARTAIIETAAALAREDGLAALSVDRVAARTGVSKGAFFHHFPTRRDMVIALIEHMAADFETDLEDRARQGKTFARALVEATFNVVERDPAFLTTLVTAVALDWSLGSEVLSRTDMLTRRMISDGLPQPAAALIRAALDGVIQHCLLRASERPDPLFIDQVRQGLEQTLFQHEQVREESAPAVGERQPSGT